MGAKRWGEREEGEIAESLPLEPRPVPVLADTADGLRLRLPGAQGRHGGLLVDMGVLQEAASNYQEHKQFGDAKFS